MADDAFCETFIGLLSRIAAQRPETVVLRCRDRIRRVAKDDIVYAATVDHDQAVHVLNGDKFAIRCSSQALFDLLSPDSSDARFFKAGSSFIVNLFYVRSFGRDGIAQLDGGASVTVPVRLRPSFEEALLSFSA